MGELKELLDSNDGGSGFSFDDMAADAAGAALRRGLPRRAARATGRRCWRGCESEADILPPLDGLPSGLSDAEFRARYGDVDSPAYAGAGRRDPRAASTRCRSTAADRRPDLILGSATPGRA